MVDALGWRCKIGLLVDAADAVAQPEYEAMRPVGVTNHTARIHHETPQRESAHGAVDAAIVRVMSAQPDHIILAGAGPLMDPASSHMCERIAGLAKRPCSTAIEALPAALTALECGSKPIAIVSTTNAGDGHIRNFFKRAGFDAKLSMGADLARSSSSAEILEATRQALLRADGPDVGALVLLDVPCPCGRLAAEAEHWLDKPVVSLGTAIYWHALRQRAVDDKVAGFGSLLERH